MSAARPATESGLLLLVVLAVALLLPACSGRSSASPGQAERDRTGDDRVTSARSGSKGRSAGTTGGNDTLEAGRGTATNGLAAPTGPLPPGVTSIPGRSGSRDTTTTTTTMRTSATTTTTTTSSLGTQGGRTCRMSTGYDEQCCVDPDPRRCDAYDLTGGVAWKPEADGTILIEYRTNAQACSFTATTLVEMARLAADTWEAAHPKVRFVDRGASTEPVASRTFNNVIGCGECGLGNACVSTDGYSEKARFSYVLSARTKWDLSRCGPTVGAPCTDTGQGIHLQSTMTHENGHVLCTARDLYHQSTEHLTMSGTGSDGIRHRATLGLGDLLMVRACYGWAPVPAVHVP